LRPLEPSRTPLVMPCQFRRTLLQWPTLRRTHRTRLPWCRGVTSSTSANRAAGEPVRDEELAGCPVSSLAGVRFGRHGEASVPSPSLRAPHHDVPDPLAVARTRGRWPCTARAARPTCAVPRSTRGPSARRLLRCRPAGGGLERSGSTGIGFGKTFDKPRCSPTWRAGRRPTSAHGVIGTSRKRFSARSGSVLPSGRWRAAWRRTFAWPRADMCGPRLPGVLRSLVPRGRRMREVAQASAAQFTWVSATIGHQRAPEFANAASAPEEYLAQGQQFDRIISSRVAAQLASYERGIARHYRSHHGDCAAARVYRTSTPRSRAIGLVHQTSSGRLMGVSRYLSGRRLASGPSVA